MLGYGLTVDRHEEAYHGLGIRAESGGIIVNAAQDAHWSQVQKNKSKFSKFDIVTILNEEVEGGQAVKDINFYVAL